MKIGYEHAITYLVEHHKKLYSEKADPDILKSIAEGIEYLCYPYREDLTENVLSPLFDPKDENTSGFDEDEDISRCMMISVRLKEVAWNALQYLREQGVDC